MKLAKMPAHRVAEVFLLFMDTDVLKVASATFRTFFLLLLPSYKVIPFISFFQKR